MRIPKTITKQVHRARAIAVLSNNPACRWLVHKAEILDELGRIESDHALLVIAKRVCELKLPTAEAIEMVRRHREFDRLADEIVQVVNDYRNRNPSTTRTEILEALEAVGTMLSQPIETGQPGRHQFLRKSHSACDSGVGQPEREAQPVAS